MMGDPGKPDVPGEPDAPEPPADPEGSTEPETKRYASLHDLLDDDDDPFAGEPFWPPVVMGLALALVISLVVLWKHGVIPWP